MEHTQRMFEAYRFPVDYLTYWHVSARTGIGPVRRFLHRMAKSGRRRLLDVGSGAGSNSLLGALAGLSVVSCDMSVASLLETRHAARLLGTTDRNATVLGDSCRMPFRSGVFDVVIASHLIEHLDDPSSLLREIDRMLRPGGVIRLSCPSTTHGMRISRWLGVRLDPEDHKVEGYDPDTLKNFLPPGLRICRVTIQGRFFESNMADAQHLMSRWLGLRANPVDSIGRGVSHHRPSAALRLAWVLKEAVLLPALLLCTLEDMVCFFLRGSMISVEIEKEPAGPCN
jgi:SAM-dependent methyltransferase